MAQLMRSVAIFGRITQDEQKRQLSLSSTSVTEFSFVELNTMAQQQRSYYCVVAIFTGNLADVTKHFFKPNKQCVRCDGTFLASVMSLAKLMV